MFRPSRLSYRLHLEILFGEFQGCDKVAAATGPLSSVKNDTATEAAEVLPVAKVS